MTFECVGFITYPYIHNIYIKKLQAIYLFYYFIRRLAPSPKPHLRSQPFSLRTSALRASQLKAPPLTYWLIFDNLRSVSYLYDVCIISAILYYSAPFVEVEPLAAMLAHFSLHVNRNGTISTSSLKSVVTVVLTSISYENA